MQPDQGTAELGLAAPLAEIVDAQRGNYTFFPGNQPSSVCSSLRPRKCETGSRVFGPRRLGASSAALRSVWVLLWLLVRSA